MPFQVLVGCLFTLAVVAVHLYLVSVAFDDMNKPGRELRMYTRTTWSFLIAFVGLAGPLGYFLYGREGRR